MHPIALARACMHALAYCGIRTHTHVDTIYYYILSDLRGQHKSFGVHKQASVHGWSNQYTIGEESYRSGQVVRFGSESEVNL
jgi:hypothetical protein